MGLLARPGAARQGHRTIACRARSRRPAAARLCDNGWPLAFAGDRAGRRSALPQAVVRLRGQTLLRASWRRSCRHGARGLAARLDGPHRLGRFDLDDAGGAPLGAARAPYLRRQVPTGHARARARACADQEPDPLTLPDNGALWRQSRGHSRRLARLFRQGAAAAVAQRSGPAGRAAAIAGNAPARSPSGGRSRGAQPRARSRGAGQGRSA